MTNFSDIFKNSFLQETGNLTTEGFVMSLLSAFVCGMIVYAVYRFFFKGVIQIAATIYTQARLRTSLFCFLLYQLSLWVG